MTTTPTLPTPDDLANAFQQTMIDWFTPADLAKVDAINASRRGTDLADSCASHDYYDTNDAMAAAWESLTAIPNDCGSDEHAVIWNTAWATAMGRGYGAGGAS